MRPSSSTSEKAASRRSKPPTAKTQSRLRTIRIQRGLTQAALANQAGMHLNTLKKAENGTTQEITPDNADALARVLRTPIAELGLRVRASTEARSIRIRRLSSEQRQLVDELLSLPPEDYVLIRGAIERLRSKRKKQRARGEGR